MKPLTEVWLSQSKRKLYGKCPFQYRLSEIEGIQPRYTPAPLRRGTMVHKGFEAALLHNFEGCKDLETLQNTGRQAIYRAQAEWITSPEVEPFISAEKKDDAEALAVDAGRIFTRSFPRLGVHTGEWETVAAKSGEPMIEWKMETPLTGWAGLHGTADWVARNTKTQHLWLWDWKTRKVLQSESADRFQLPHPTYIELLRITEGVELAGAVTFQITAKVPKQPKQLKDGSISKAACATDWATYKAAVEAAGLDVKDYEFMKTATDTKGNRKLSLKDTIHFYYWSQQAVKKVFNSCMLGGASSMENSYSELKNGGFLEDCFPRNINPMTCRGCSHRTYCEADIRGEDTEFLARTEYMREGEQLVPEVELYSDDD